MISEDPKRMTDKTEDSSNEPKRARQARQKRLGDQLRRLYDDVANEPVPDEFLKLLQEADKAEQEDENDVPGDDERSSS